MLLVNDITWANDNRENWPIDVSAGLNVLTIPGLFTSECHIRHKHGEVKTAGCFYNSPH